jgi:DNA anti-recombination protein RmuC
LVIFRGEIIMKKNSKELQKIKGIGEALSKRLIEAGYDTFDKIAAAGEAGLKKIKGFDRLRPIKSIVDQATTLAQESKKKKARRVKDLKAATATIRGHVEGLARRVKDRFGDQLTEKGSKQIEKQLLKMTAVLDKVKDKLESGVKPAAKRLAKAEKKLAGIPERTADATQVIKGLKKVRRSLKKIYSR